MNDPVLEIVTVDPFDEALVVPWHSVYAKALRHSVGEAAEPYSLDEVRAMMQQPPTDQERTAYVGLAGGAPVASGFVSLPLRDNLTSAQVDVEVLPDAQGRGHGRAMLAHVEGVATGAGRTLLNCEARWRYEHGTDGHEGDGSRDVAFAEAAGYALGLSDVQRWVDLPVDDALLERLAADSAPHHRDYELRSWAGPVPDEIAESWVALDSSLTTEAPTGDLEVEAQDADVALLREYEVMVAEQGRTMYHTVALDGAGEVVAYTTIAHGRSRSAYQWGTLVRRGHRGHRLGLAVKIANHRQVQAARPDLARISTYNAESNAHMIAVNELMGFRPVGRLGEFQKRV